MWIYIYNGFGQQLLLARINNHPIPGSNRIFQNWTGNMQNSDIFVKKYRNRIENNACTRHLWRSRSSYLEVYPQIWYWRFSLLKNGQHAILSESSWMSTGSTACSKFTMTVEYFCCQTCNLIFQWVHQHAQLRGYLISSVHASFIVFEMVKPHVDYYSHVENSGKCWWLTFRMFWFFMNMQCYFY